MRIVEINMVSHGSTGNIMLQIAACARQQGHEVRTFSTHLFSRRYRKLPAPPEGHRYYGFYLENGLHFILGRVFGWNGCFSAIGTWRLLRTLERTGVDVLHLHNLHGSCVDLPMLFRYIKRRRLPVVWTLHDCWSFTGHCPNFDMVGCDRWKTGCGQCPQRSAYPASFLDTSRWMYRRKKKWFTGVENMTLAVPSNWLAGLVKQSFLGNYPVKLIPNGVDLSVFRPTESDFRTLHRCGDKFVVLGVAFDWGRRKGLDVFARLADRLGPGYQIVLVGVGERAAARLPEQVIALERTRDRRELAAIYTAADVLVNPTREDVLGMVNLEALACGTPVVTFRTGGCVECVDETCGAVVEKDDVDALEREVRRIAEERPFSTRACMDRARQFEMNERFKEYVQLYENCSCGAQRALQ